MLVIGALASRCAAQDSSTLDKIAVTGLKKLTPEQVIASSGLQIGQAVDREILRDAVDKMMKTKLYSSVGFHVSTEDNKSTVTFEVIESTKPTPQATPTPTRPRTTRRRPSQ